MSVLDNIKHLLRNNGHVEAQTKETLIKCFEQLLAGTGEITSPNGTIDIVAGNPTTVDINGLPPGNATNDLGAVHTRWNDIFIEKDAALWFTPGGVIPQSNAFKYTNLTGPTFFDGHTFKNLIFDVQSLTAHRTAEWPDESGLVMYVEDFQNGPTISTILEGSHVTSAADYLYNTYIHNAAGNLTNVEYSLNDPFYHDRAGVVTFVTFKFGITTLTLSGTNMSSNGLSLTPSITADQCVGLLWDVGTAKWTRFQ